MSVIHEALKTAQREKQSREASPAGSPAIMPMRGRGEEPFNWRNALTIALASIVIVASVASLWWRMRGPAPRAAENIPVVMVPADISPADRSPSVPDDRVAPAGAVAAAPQRPDAGSSRVAQVLAPRQAPTVATSRAAARPTRSDTAASAPVTREPAQSSRLRIAVEQPREGDLARIFAAGVAAHRAGDLVAARAAYERVIAASPNDVDALNNLGVVLGAVGEVERGEGLLRRAVQLAPNHTGAWNNLGTLLAQRGQPSDAIAAFQQALTLDPRHQGARVSLAQQHLAIGAPARAREILEAVIAANPSMPEAYYTLGQAFEMEKDWAGAVRAYGGFVRVAPSRLAGIVERVQQRMQMLNGRVR